MIVATNDLTNAINFQHVLLSLASSLTMSLVVADTLCAHPGHPIRAHLFSTTLFMAGVCTVVQTYIGVRSVCVSVRGYPLLSNTVTQTSFELHLGNRMADSQINKLQTYFNKCK